MSNGNFPSSLPAPRTLDPMTAPPLRWGVLGTGWIAERFISALHRDTRQKVVAIGSRSIASAKAFADGVGVGRAHGTYADLVADTEVDVVYVATPHNFHRTHALLALDACKHVLVEKPIALNAEEAQEVADQAQNPRLAVLAQVHAGDTDECQGRHPGLGAFAHHPLGGLGGEGAGGRVTDLNGDEDGSRGRGCGACSLGEAGGGDGHDGSWLTVPDRSPTTSSTLGTGLVSPHHTTMRPAL